MRCVALLAAALVVAASGGASEPLSIDQLFLAPTRSAPALSPDGSHYAAITRELRMERVVVAPLAGGTERELARWEGPEETLSWIAWPKPGRLLVATSQSLSGFDLALRLRRTRLYALSLTDGARRELARFARVCEPSRAVVYANVGLRFKPGECEIDPLPVQDEVLHALPDHPTDVLVVYREPSARVRRLNLETGERSSVEIGEGRRDGFAADPSGVIRVAISRSRGKRHLHARARADAPWRIVASYDPQEPERAVAFAGFAKDPAKLYVIARLDGRDALYTLDIETGERALAAASPTSAVAAVRGGAHTPVAGVQFADGKLVFLDAAAEREQALVDALLPRADNEIAGETAAQGRLSVVGSRGTNGLRTYYTLDRARGAVQRLYAEREFDPARIVPPELPHGLGLRAALTRPPRFSGGAAVILLRSDPVPADLIGFDPEVQALASRGFAVLELDLGARAIDGAEVIAWRDALANSVLRAAAWLEGEGIAPSDRIGVYGAGFGGYAALVAASREPKRFASVALLSPVVSLRELVGESAHFRLVWPLWLADPDECRQATRLKEDFAALRAPLLIGHSRGASRAQVVQSRSLAEDLRRAGREITDLEQEGDTDALALAENGAGFFSEWAAFYERLLAVADARSSRE